MPRGHALIVDDSSTARIMLARLLERARITTKSVASAEEAFDRLQHEHFDIIFLDHLLPGMNGFQALDKLKSQAETRDIPVFMYTSQNAERYLTEAKTRGAAGVIGKQVDRDQLQNILEAILAGQASTAEYTQEPEDSLPQNDIERSHTRRFTGRLSTLEIAFEESYDDLRQLKQSLAKMEVLHQERLDSNQRRMKWLWATTLIGFTALAIVLSVQVTGLTGVIEGIKDELQVMQELLGSMVELIDQ
ncbi:response regulator [Marinobacter caseinilyticus]|uniref:response regulator n=1 Tax=Marinobacter caseinilyticus TaxID=2692195 RepID=UPI00140D5736|nr:response regulator [Marinobacter caseinilyticus]